MTRRDLFAAALAPAVLRAAARKPNIVFIVADDLGYGELGCQGNPEIPTPHIDSLARQGVRFTQGYVTAPMCAPSRAGFMTGRFPSRFGHEATPIGRQNLQPHLGLPLAETTMANCLKAAGYATGIFGKWHLGGTPELHPQKRGFDEFFGFLHEGHFYLPPPYRGGTTRLRPNEPPYDDVNSILRGAEPVVETEYLTRAFTREALAFLDRHAREPFFLYLPYNAIHSPMQALTEDMRRFRISDEHRGVFAGMLASLDDGVGAVLARLRKLGLEENTLVFFISDNGGPTAELTSSNKPLRGGKGQLYEGGIRVPFLMRWKGAIPAGRVFEQLVCSVDLLPTAVAAAGGSLPSGRVIDGVNLLPFLAGAGGGRPHELLFWRHQRSCALRRGDWKIVMQGVRREPATAWQLYDLAADPGETRDLAGQRPALVAALSAEYDRLNAQMAEPRMPRNN
ncbi:MAG: sulfatase [Bryobacteraceae bacterium]